MESTKKNWQWFWEQLDIYLLRSGLKQTKQRKIVVEAFLSLGNHVEAEALYQKLKREGYAIGLATVYRTLNVLKEANLVSQHAFSDGRSVFEVHAPDQHHDHLICNQCGTIEEFHHPTIESLQIEIAKQHNFTLLSHRMDLFGLCQTCSAQTANTRHKR
jgi:Fur family ferric uptake transcriptional regulator